MEKAWINYGLQNGSRILEKGRLEWRMRTQPGVVAFSPSVRSVTVHVTNPLDDTAHVDLALRMKYPQVDGSGTLVPDSAGTTTLAKTHNMTPWVHGLPAHITIAPHGTRQLTLTVTPPHDVRDGEYWTALIATARGVEIPYTFSYKGQTVHQKFSRPVDIFTTVPLTYRQGTMTAGLQLQGATAAMQGDSIIRVCPQFHHMGSARALTTLRVTLKTGTPALDTAAVTTLPLEIYEDMTPCVPVDVKSVPPGTYVADVSVADNSQDVPSEVRAPIPAVHTTVSFTITPQARSLAEAVRARDTTPDVSDSVFTSVKIEPAGNRSVQSFVSEEVAKAIKQGRTPIVQVSATWCGPCRLFERLMLLPGMRETMRGMYVIHVDVDVWKGPVGAYGVMGYPQFAILRHTGTLVRFDPSPLLKDSNDLPRPGERMDAALIRQLNPMFKKLFDDAKATFAKRA